MNFWKQCDPRSKTLVAIALSFALAMAPVTKSLAFLPVAVFFLVTSGIDRGRMTRVLLAVLLLWGLSFLANALDILLGGRSLEEGLAAGLSHGARLATLAFLSAWVMATTGALELAGSMEWMVRRSPSLRRGAHRAMLPVVLGLRMIPMFSDEARRMVEVDRLRAGPQGNRGRVRRLARLAPVWMVTVVERADALALALTLRGYRPDVERGFARPFRWTVRDWGLAALGGTGVFYLGWM